MIQIFDESLARKHFPHNRPFVKGAGIRNIDMMKSALQTLLSWQRSFWIRSQTHYSDVRMSVMASQIIGVSIVYSIVCPGADQRKHQSPPSLVFVREIRRRRVNSTHQGASNAENENDVTMYNIKYPGVFNFLFMWFQYCNQICFDI